MINIIFPVLANIVLYASPIGGNYSNGNNLTMIQGYKNNAENNLIYENLNGFYNDFDNYYLNLLYNTSNSTSKILTMAYNSSDYSIDFTFNNGFLTNLMLNVKITYEDSHQGAIQSDSCFIPLYRENDNFSQSLALDDIDTLAQYTFEFTFYTIPSDFADAYNGNYEQNAYNVGYTQGYNDAVNDRIDEGYIFNYNDMDDEYNSGYDDGREIGYQEGYNEASEELNETNTTASLIFTGILSVGLLPVNVFLSILDFEVFGINIAGFISGLLSVCIIIIIFRTILGGKNNND